MADATVTSRPSAGGGGGGGDIVDALSSGASLDGVMSYEEQSSAPDATAAYVKLYSKNVLGAGDALYNFTSGDPTADDIRSGNAGTITGSPHSGTQYVTNHESIGVAFGDQMRISNVNHESTDPTTPGHLFNIPSHGIGAGAFTIEFFYDPADIHTSVGAGVFCMGYDTYGTNFDVSLHSSDIIQLRDVNASSVSFIKYDYDWESDAGTMKHWAICRNLNAPATGQCQYTIFIDGVELPINSAQNAGSGITAHPKNVFGAVTNFDDSYNDYLSLGGWRASASSFKRAIEAVYDSVLITRSCKYPAGSPPSPVPSAPFTDPGQVAKLFAVDSNGNRTQLTP